MAEYKTVSCEIFDDFIKVSFLHIFCSHANCLTTWGIHIAEGNVDEEKGTTQKLNRMFFNVIFSGSTTSS